jgi:hypothetical protein
MEYSKENEKSTEDIDIMSYINKDKLNLINDAFNKLGMGLVSTHTYTYTYIHIYITHTHRHLISFFK